MTGLVYRLPMEKALRLVQSGDNFKIVHKAIWKDARTRGEDRYSYSFPVIAPVKRRKVKKVTRNTKDKLIKAENREARIFQRKASNRFKKTLNRRVA